MDMKIAGSGVLGAGEYDKVTISGSAKAEGLIRCKQFQSAGAFSGSAEIECEEDIRVSGAFSCDGKITAKEFRSSGSTKTGGLCAETITVAGALKTTGDLVSSGYAEVSGGFKCEGNIKASELNVAGGLKVTGDLEAENAYISGGISCGGLINAENLRIDLDSSTGSKAESVGGSKIVIENKREKGLIAKLFGKSKCDFTVAESIEGDEIIIEHTKAKTVTGRYVMIGEDCEIGLVQYTESAEVSSKSKVGKCEKI